MPIPLFGEVFDRGLSNTPYLITVLKTAPWLFLLYALKRYFSGAINRSERVMHSKVVMMTGGTSGIGACVARELASRGAQIILLTQHSLTDPFLVDYIMDLRNETGNELITAEQCDLASLHSIRQFATKWIDNSPPRRLDMVVLCANTLTPAGGKITQTEDGLESNWGVNYMANFHLLSILSPALRVQPPDRSVRILIGMCPSYMGGSLTPLLPTDAAPAKSKKTVGDRQLTPQTALPFTPSTAYATSKLALLTFAHALQKHLSSTPRPDKLPPNAHVIVVDPGFARTPGMHRWITFGSLWGLLMYLILYPVWWLVLKSPMQGAQSFLHAAMEQGLVGEAFGDNIRFVKECRVVRVGEGEWADEGVQGALWKESEKTIERLEREGAMRRARAKKPAEGKKVLEVVEEEEEEVKSSGSAQKQVGSRRSRKAITST